MLAGYVSSILLVSRSFTNTILTGSDEVTLPDLATDSPKVQKIFNEWISDMVANYSIDGLRLDTAKHLSGYLSQFQNAGMGPDFENLLWQD